MKSTNDPLNWSKFSHANEMCPALVGYLASSAINPIECLNFRNYALK